MKNWKWVAVTLIFAVPAFLTGRIIWPPNHEMMPTASQLPFFIFLSALESLVFGIGISFLLFSYPLVKKLAGKSKNVALLMYITVGWLMISWWPHDNMHASNGMNMAGLLRIELIFHFTLMLSGLTLAYCFFKLYQKAK